MTVRTGKQVSRGPSRNISAPEPGYFRMRLVKGGPFVGARIWQEHGELVAHIAGTRCDVDRVWLFGRFSDAAEYARLMKSTLDPREVPDLHRLPSPF